MALQTIKICIAVREGKLNEALYCACGVAYGFSSAVLMIFNVGCDLRDPCSEIRNANLQFQKRNVSTQCVCVLELVWFMTR